MGKPRSPAQKDRRFLVPDTSVLWHETKDVAVSPKFSEFLASHRRHHNIEILIPEVVMGELLYQHSSTGLALLNKAARNLENLSQVTQANYASKVNEERVRKDVLSKFEKWSSSIGARKIDTPIKTIKWDQLVESAIWRLPPFIEEENKRSEKGFRDALILETAVSHSVRNPSSYVDFISTDKLLRDSVRARRLGKLSVFESLSDYSSHLRLLEQELTEKFVAAISDRAAQKFFGRPGHPGLLETEKIRARAKQEHSENFSPPTRGSIPNLPALGDTALATTQPPTSTNALAGLFGATRPRWDPASDESMWIYRPEFVSRDGRNVYNWRSVIKFVQFFRNMGGRGGSILTGIIEANELRMREVFFNVNWCATVGIDGRFARSTLNELEFKEASFRIPAREEVDRYGSSLAT